MKFISYLSSQQPLAEFLIKENKLTPDQLQVALMDQRQNLRPLEDILIDYNYVSSFDICKFKAKQIDVTFIDLTLYPIYAVHNQLPQDIIEKTQALIFKVEENCLHIAMRDPEDILLKDIIRAHIQNMNKQNYVLKFYLACKIQIESAVHELNRKNNHAFEDSPSVLLDHIIEQAIYQEASDIHFQPELGEVIIKLRTDGVLQFYKTIHKLFWPNVINRLKVQSQLDITETRRPQTGHFSKIICSRTIDIRVSTHPTLRGENVVLRILDKEKETLNLSQLGFPPSIVKNLSCAAKSPQGLIILTGPTGSGKTTTLYALLKTMNSQSRNIMTLEEPIESVLPGVRQTEIREGHPLTYEDALRSLLRQDPDVILLGEIRDSITAQMALRAVLTGHLVLSTLHTQDAIGVPTRLIELGLSQALLSGAFLGIAAQRLVRRMCRQCEGKGCLQCRGGYKGRIALVEYIPCDNEFNDMIGNGALRKDYIEYCKKHNILSLWDYASLYIKEKMTTEEEIHRILGQKAFM